LSPRPAAAGRPQSLRSTGRARTRRRAVPDRHHQCRPNDKTGGRWVSHRGATCAQPVPSRRGPGAMLAPTTRRAT
jgi:hypothetical protein